MIFKEYICNSGGVHDALNVVAFHLLSYLSDFIESSPPPTPSTPTTPTPTPISHPPQPPPNPNPHPLVSMYGKGTRNLL